MPRCVNCNGILKADEKQCYACDTPVFDEKSRSRSARQQHFATCIKMMFFLSLALMGVSMFTHYGPPFSTCLVTSLVLLLVMSSANHMLEKKGR
jgi:hypothetical protein